MDKDAVKAKNLKELKEWIALNCCIHREEIEKDTNVLHTYSIVVGVFMNQLLEYLGLEYVIENEKPILKKKE